MYVVWVNAFIFSWLSDLKFSHLALICIDSFQHSNVWNYWSTMNRHNFLWCWDAKSRLFCEKIYCLENFLKELMVLYYDSISDFMHVYIYVTLTYVTIYNLALILYCFKASQSWLFGGYHLLLPYSFCLKQSFKKYVLPTF